MTLPRYRDRPDHLHPLRPRQPGRSLRRRGGQAVLRRMAGGGGGWLERGRAGRHEPARRLNVTVTECGGTPSSTHPHARACAFRDLSPRSQRSLRPGTYVFSWATDAPNVPKIESPDFPYSRTRFSESAERPREKLKGVPVAISESRYRRFFSPRVPGRRSVAC